jgi:ureidoglycolate dehydrogenase (NAD+)
MAHDVSRGVGTPPTGTIAIRRPPTGAHARTDLFGFSTTAFRIRLTAFPFMTRNIPADALRAWVTSVFQSVGMPASDASDSARMLVQTSLWGIDSHGVARVPHYLARLTRKSIVADARPTFERSAPGTGTVDGGDGLGFVVSQHAMTRAIELARETGVGAVGVRNSSHCGAVGLYARQAANAGMIGIALTHSDAFAVPYGGTKKFFGTNPIAIAIPSTDPRRPFCVDMATSVIPWNRIANAKRENRSIPPGVAVDADGRDTTDPHQVAGVKPMGDHKGYALAFAIDMLCGPLNGMTFGPHLTRMYTELDQQRKLGSLMIALDPQRFGGGAALAMVVATAMAEVRQQSGVLSPGDPEYRTEDERSQHGIPIEPGLQDEYRTWSQRLGVPLPAGLAS